MVWEFYRVHEFKTTTVTRLKSKNSMTVILMPTKKKCSLKQKNNIFLGKGINLKPYQLKVT